MHKKVISMITGKAAAAVAALLFFTASVPAQQADPAPAAPAMPTSGQILLWALIVMACVLAIVVAAMASLLATGTRIKYSGKQPGKDSPAGRTGLVLLPVLLLTGNSSYAQDAGAASPAYGDLSPFLFWLLCGIILVLLGFIAVMYRAIMGMLKAEEAAVAPVAKKAGFLEKLNASVPLEQEKDVLLDHNYDGIRELDNNLPPWWKYGFYVTIIFSVIYLWRYHVSESAPLQLAEYQEQLATAEVQVATYKEKMGNLVDENSVTALNEGPALANGKSMYTANCAACHGQAGEGGVGPNLTDAYWLHGGGVQNIFKSIKYGWPQKGMKAWEKDFGAKQIQELSSYILKLQGTNPPNGKERQGELWEEAPAQADSSRATALK